MPKNVDPTPEEYRDLYDKADSFAREVWQFRRTVALPAHNQLRYAGHHLLKSLGPDGTITDIEKLREAISHCERAMYEAAEAGIGAAINRIETFKKDHQRIAIGKIVPEIRDAPRLIREAQSMISAPRSDNLPASEETARYMEVFRALRDLVDRLEGSHDDLVIEARRQRFKDGLGIFGVVTGIITACAVVFRLFFC